MGSSFRARRTQPEQDIINRRPLPAFSILSTPIDGLTGPLPPLYLQLRVLLAFLAFDDISVLPKDSVLAVLDEAAADPDEVGGCTH